MKIENHIEKIDNIEKSVSKLDLKEDYEAIVELYMLIASHYINACLHKKGALNISKDIKHNKLFSFLKDGEKLGVNTETLGNLMKNLDDLRPSHVYGRGHNGNTGIKAFEYYKEIKNICLRILDES